MLEKLAPPIVGQIKEIAIVWEIVEPELKLIAGAIKRLPLSIDASTADEDAVIRLERLYGIIPYTNQSIEERKAIIKAKQSIIRPFTMVTIKRLLETIVGGRDGYMVELDKEHHLLHVYLAASEDLLELAWSILRPIIPANLCLVTEPLSTERPATKWHLCDENGAVLVDENGDILTDEEVQ